MRVSRIQIPAHHHVTYTVSRDSISLGDMMCAGNAHPLATHITMTLVSRIKGCGYGVVGRLAVADIERTLKYSVGTGL